MDKTIHTTPPAVLIVDDLESDIDILMECLSDRYRVKVALDGASALETIREEPPDLILLDILMPGLDGYEVCRQIKADEKTVGIPILFVTGLSEATDETRGFELGAVDYITKPFNFSVIRARIKTHLELAEARKNLEGQNTILSENLRLREQMEHITRHDLKNPIHIILSAAELLTLCPDMPKDQMSDLLGQQVKSCDTMLNLINRSLDLYKMENGFYKLETRDIDILPILDRVILGLNHISEEKTVSTEIRINGRRRRPGDRFKLVCEELLFYAMISNLIQNALEASPREACVSVSLHDIPMKGICIENRGAVTPDVRELFFEKFITSGKKKGTGIGTYSARMIAEIHNAGIRMSTSDEEDVTRVIIDWRTTPE